MNNDSMAANIATNCEDMALLMRTNELAAGVFKAAATELRRLDRVMVAVKPDTAESIDNAINALLAIKSARFPESATAPKEFYAEIDRIAGDYSPSTADEAVLALGEMRDALHAAPSNFAQRPASPAPCQCAACKDVAIHASDCAVHNAPALPVGECDCGAATPAQSAEPVATAYRVERKGHVHWEISRHGDLINGQKLYTAPQPSQTAVVLDDERAAFEAAMRKIGYLDFARNGDAYTNPALDNGWEGWQARAALPKPVAQHVEQTAQPEKINDVQISGNDKHPGYSSRSDTAWNLRVAPDSALDDDWNTEFHKAAMTYRAASIMQAPDAFENLKAIAVHPVEQTRVCDHNYVNGQCTKCGCISAGE